MKRLPALLLFGFLTISLCGAAWSVTSGYSLSITSYTGSVKSVSKSLTVSRGSATGSISYFYILISGAGVDANYAPDNRRVYAGSSIAGNSIQIFIRRTASTSATEVGSNNSSGSLVIGGSISASSSSKSVSIYFYTDTGVVPAATYTNSFTYQVYTTGTTQPYDSSYYLTSTSATPVATGTMTLNVTSSTSSSSFSLSLNPTSLAFDDLIPDVAPIQNVTLSIKAPANYAVAAQSANKGIMTLSGETDTLSYHLIYNSSIFYLADGIVQLFKSSTGTGSSTVDYVVTVELDAVGMQEPGTYTDNLYFTFTSQ